MNRVSPNRGFTLIELLVVIFIISIVTSVALLSIGRNENKKIEAFAKQFTQLLTLAQEKAMLQPVVIGLVLEKHSFHFASFSPAAGDKKIHWTSLDDKLLGKTSIPDDIELSLHVSSQKQNLDADDEEETHDPQIIISTNGDLTPFTLYIGMRGQKPRYVLTGDADGRVTQQSIS